VRWDTETLGCSPSLSSIPTKDQRLFSDAVGEIADWLRQPENRDEFLVLFLDDERDLEAWVRGPACCLHMYTDTCAACTCTLTQDLDAACPGPLF
jgi:hypothetical protein